jgi:predicted PurR-regulated permease PerM
MTPDPHSRSLGRKIAGALAGYAKSQLVMGGVVAVMAYIVLALLRVRFALPLAVFTGALSIVPVAGMAIAAVISAAVAGLDGSRFIPNAPEITESVAVLAAYVLLNLLADYLFSPLIVGRSVNIHPLLLLAAVITGTALLGIPGAILAVPVLIIAKTVRDHSFRN